MPRWQPDTQERLVRAALDLYAAQGYDRTTVGQIAERAGVTSRTYFRYFPDKREVLFVNARLVCDAIVEATAEALKTQRPYRAVQTGVTAARSVFADREFVERREAVIATSEELREREAVKLVTISTALKRVLVESGSDEAIARVTADLGVAIFTEATRRWQSGDESPYGELVREAAKLVRKAAAPR